MKHHIRLVSLHVELLFLPEQIGYGGGARGGCLVSRLFEKELTKELLGQLTSHRVPIHTGVSNEAILCLLSKSNVEHKPHPLFELKGSLSCFGSESSMSLYVSSLVTAGWTPNKNNLAYHGISLVTM